MRILRQRSDHDRKGSSRSKSQSDGRGHAAGNVQCALPLPCAYPDDAGDQTIPTGGEGMSLSRRDFLKTSGALIVTFSMAPEFMFAQRLDGASSNQLDAWLSINADGTVTANTGKCELGQGLFTAQTQLIAEELSVPLNRVKLIQCDTALTPDQGTTSGAQ